MSGRGLSRRVGTVGASLALVLQLAAGTAGQGVNGPGQMLLGGAVRAGLPAAVWAPAGLPWQACWSGVRIEVSGNAASFLWPDDGAIRMSGPGAPPSGSVRRLPPDAALVGVLPGAAGLLSESPALARLRDEIESGLRRRARFVRLESELQELGAAVLAALDLVAAADRAELERSPAVRGWIGIGGHGLVVEPRGAGPLGFGTVLWAGGAQAALADLGGAFATVQPPCPPVPEAPDPPRVPALLAVAVFVAAVWWGAGARSRRCGLISAGLAAVSAAFILGFLGEGHWTTAARRSYWLFAIQGADPWVHTCLRVAPRGDRPAEVWLPGGPYLLTRVPEGAEVRAAPGGLRARWQGDGWLAALTTARFGEGFCAREIGGRLFVSARLPEGISLESAFWLARGEVRSLPPLRGGDAWSPEEAPPVAPAMVPEPLRSLGAALPALPLSGVLLGELRGAPLEGENHVCALPGAGGP
ncbi:MAG: hypothetical protein JXQ29_05765 [Planctomycetes bacterium]|nr:hypothetical protein [Planctomycetota bacterium]